MRAEARGGRLHFPPHCCYHDDKNTGLDWAHLHPRGNILNSTSFEAKQYRLKPHDLAWALLSLAFAAFSLAWPRTGSSGEKLFGLERGYLLFFAYLGVAALSLLMPLAEAWVWRRSASDPGAKPRRAFAAAFSFVRTYYPQAFIALFFSDSILLSAQAFGGYSHDAFFEAADQAIFGFQPAREFARALGSRAWINELMFGSYFAYFAFMVIAVWLPYLKGDREEGEKQIFVVAATMAIVCTWYVFFRVQGPKYWLPDLKSSWYNDTKGGLFVFLFQASIANATLSGAAFPSTHVILTLTTLGLSWRNDKRFFAVYLPVACLIILSTVYIYAHWAADILGGALVSALLPPLLYRGFGRCDRVSQGLSRRLASGAQ
jgi:membrane-associated phospholipid phosphatase